MDDSQDNPGDRFAYRDYTLQNNGGWKLGIVNPDGVVKTLHLLRCHKFSIITKHLFYIEMIENFRVSNQKLFT
jgi:hypothetical protein